MNPTYQKSKNPISGYLGARIQLTNIPPPPLGGGYLVVSRGTKKAAEKYRAALGRIPPPGTGFHGALMGIANLAARAGIPEGRAAAEIIAAVPRGSRTVTQSEIVEAIRKAWGDLGKPFDAAPVVTPPARDWAAYRSKLIARFADATEAELWERSPVRVTRTPGPRDAVETLGALYRPEDRLFLGGRMDRTVKPVSDWVKTIESGAAPEHIIPNPLTGKEHPTKTDGKLSPRCDAAVSALRFVVCEMDSVPRADQVRLWVAIIEAGLLPVAALIDSAGKSIHAWVKVNLPDVEAWDRTVRGELYGPAGILTGLGFDRACANPARLSRLPGHYRTEKKAFQRLLYLNPEP